MGPWWIKHFSWKISRGSSSQRDTLLETFPCFVQLILLNCPCKICCQRLEMASLKEKTKQNPASTRNRMQTFLLCLCDSFCFFLNPCSLNPWEPLSVPCWFVQLILPAFPHKDRPRMGVLNNTLDSCVSHVGEKWICIWVQNLRASDLETEWGWLWA